MKAAAGRGLFAVLGALEAVVGVWAAIWPARFYRSFPGGGWHWVQAAGVYDEHLVRDFGGLSMALGVVALAAALRPSRTAAVTAAAAWEVYSVPHLAYHASHLGSLPSVQDAADAASLALTVVVPLLATVLLWRTPPPASSGWPEGGAHQAPDAVGVGEDVDLTDLAVGHGEGHHR